MTKFLHFFSIALLTQIVLMMSQLVLLPMQIRLWGQAPTAEWYAALALANITTVVDFGLRTAGHAELLAHVRSGQKSSEAGDYFRQVWTWVRLLMLTMTVAVVAGQASYTAFLQHASYPLWKVAVILAYSLETLLVIRIIYLDTLGLYRGAEVSYFIFAALRLMLSVPAILIFHVGVSGLATLFLVTSAAAVGMQGYLLCRRLEPLKILAKPPHKLSVDVLLLARHTVAEPLANWVRLNLPVVIIASIASPAAVTTYVGLRAAFGAARTTIQQISRVASVEYLRFRADGRAKQAGALFLSFLLLASLVATFAAVAVITDNMRLLGLWLSKIDRDLFQTVTAAFVLSAPFYAYQIPLNLMFRSGELPWIARRHYVYAIYAAAFALASLKVTSLSFYVATLVVSEIALSVSFMFAGKAVTSFPNETRRGLLLCAGGSSLALVLWTVVRMNILPFLARNSQMAAIETIAFAGVCLLILTCGEYLETPQVAEMMRPIWLKFNPARQPAA